jgi:hypothetical protein
VLPGTYHIGIYPYYFTFFITGDPSLPGNYRGKEIPQNDTFCGNLGGRRGGSQQSAAQQGTIASRSLRRLYAGATRKQFKEPN